jgi:hypothetical protein
MKDLYYRAATKLAAGIGIEDKDTCPTMPPGFDNVKLLFQYGKWAALVVCVGALIGFFGYLAVQRQQGGGGGGGSIGWLGKILIAIIGISGVFGLFGAILTAGC